MKESLDAVALGCNSCECTPWENDMWQSIPLAFLFSVSLPALSQQALPLQLPPSLEGKWVNNAGSKIYSGRIAFQVDSRAENGSISGKWTFEGVRCKGSRLPATASYDGVQLIITSRIDDGAVCGMQTATFKRTDRSGTHSLFEGRLGGDGKIVIGSDVDVFLDPK
jgi:hypothetical protein